MVVNNVYGEHQKNVSPLILAPTHALRGSCPVCLSDPRAWTLLGQVDGFSGDMVRAFAKAIWVYNFDLLARRTGGLTSDQQPLYPEIPTIVRRACVTEGGEFHVGICSGLLYTSGRHLICSGQMRSTPTMTAVIFLAFFPAKKFTPSCGVFASNE